MSEGNSRASSQLGILRAAYEDAFRRWSAEVERTRVVRADGAVEESASTELRRRVAETRKAYHEARDMLAARLLERTAKPGGRKPSGSEGPRRAEVERLAYEMWEKRGRRAGDPEADWFQAEQRMRDMPGSEPGSFHKSAAQ